MNNSLLLSTALVTMLLASPSKADLRTVFGSDITFASSGWVLQYAPFLLRFAPSFSAPPSPSAAAEGEPEDMSVHKNH